MIRQAALAPAESFYSSDGWLELLEGHGHGHRYLLLGEADRAVLAPVTDGEAVESGRYRPGFLLADRVEADRCLLAGPLSGYRNELRSGTGRPPAGEVAHGLLAAAAGRTVLLPYLPTVTAAGFEAAGYPGAVIAWDAWLDVPDAGFDEYLARLPRGHREQVKGDLRRIKRAGITFDAMPLQEPFRDLAELLVQHERKYDPGYRQPSERFAHYLARCAGLPGAHVILARRDGRVVGCHVVFPYTGVLWARLIGVDESSVDTRGEPGARPARPGWFGASISPENGASAVRSVGCGLGALPQGLGTFCV
ncbi:hypothetical protein YW3DRAFT_06454 [Streptomyces sp. MnatMP-M77]|uniref:GNAT family N-acetyltransferase n=1 Tax=unclassified Streptomyces TaxID=2593676 RepID=UPI000804F91D|nr:GNAT family N-acetyltransferase [Streptomyces sp. MnatMP-M77]MYT77473.1 GNAT family N-acetyltransferase [Streptomyces sp. SID8364]SBU99108.1 hypothetical protein YW3DRAFT_06454 [Streptomyces sp. MnatMP-M77]